MPVLLKMLVEYPCQSVAEAIQKSVDNGGIPIEVTLDGRVLMDERQIREKSAQLS